MGSAAACDNSSRKAWSLERSTGAHARQGSFVAHQKPDQGVVLSVRIVAVLLAEEGIEPVLGVLKRGAKFDPEGAKLR